MEECADLCGVFLAKSHAQVASVAHRPKTSKKKNQARALFVGALSFHHCLGSRVTVSETLPKPFRKVSETLPKPFRNLYLGS
jgi:hypothetical protein